MDRSIKPGDNFYDTPTAPGSRNRDPCGSQLLRGRLDPHGRHRSPGADLIQAAARVRLPPGPNAGDWGLYASFMDSTRIDKAGLRPVKALWIRLPPSATGRISRGARHHAPSRRRRLNATKLLTPTSARLWVAQDLDDPAHYSPFLLQGGLGMPDRSYYVDSSPTMATIRDKYQAHIAAMLSLAEIPDARPRPTRSWGSRRVLGRRT